MLRLAWFVGEGQATTSGAAYHRRHERGCPEGKSEFIGIEPLFISSGLARWQGKAAPNREMAPRADL